jgi:hypothetical protein
LRLRCRRLLLLLGGINRRRLNPFESGQLGLDKFQPVVGERGNLLSRKTCKKLSCQNSS